MCVAILLAVFPAVAHPQAQSVNQQLVVLVQTAQAARADHDYAEAIDSFSAALSLIGKTSQENAAFLLNEISVTERQRGRYQEALNAARKAVERQGAAGGKAAATVYLYNEGLAASDMQMFDYAVNVFARVIADADGALQLRAAARLGEVLIVQGNHVEAIRILTLALHQAPPNSYQEQIMVLHALARSQLSQRLDYDAEDTLRKATALTSDGIPGWLAVENRNLQAQRLTRIGRGTEAAELLLPQLSSSLSPVREDRLMRAAALYNLSEIEFQRGRFAEAEDLNLQAELSYSAEYGTVHFLIGQILLRRAIILQEIGDPEEALIIYDQAGTIFSKALGSDSQFQFNALTEKARALSRLGRHQEAILGARALVEKADPKGRIPEYDRILAVAALGLALHASGDRVSAADTLENALARWGAGNYSTIDLPPGLDALAAIRLSQNRPADAIALARQAISIHQRTEARTVDRIGESRRMLAAGLAMSGDREGAKRIAADNIALAEDRLALLALHPSRLSDFAPYAVRAQVGQMLDLHWPAAEQTSAQTETLFRAAQLLHMTETTRAATGYMRRLSLNQDGLGLALRERSAALVEMRALSKASLAELSPEDAAQMLAKLDALGNTISHIDRDLARDEPEAMAWLAQRPVDIAQMQAALAPDEALWMQATSGTDTFMFLLRRDGISLSRANLSESRLRDLVDRLRASVDVLAPGGLPAFDIAASEELFTALFGGFKAELASISRLYLVPDLASQEVQLGILARPLPGSHPQAGPEIGDLRYLGLTHALAVLPSPTTFVLLRSLPPPDLKGGFVGFGDPVLEGTGASVPGGGPRAAINRISGLAEPRLISQMFEPLEDTADELRALAGIQRSGNAEIFLRELATETQVKRMDFGETSVIAFATHAIVAGDFDMLLEPALIMSPPQVANALDDGLLTAGEISGLSLSADLVILSACNTAAPVGRSGAPGLSGLASGFFRAGTRSVVASHWTILSLSSILLVPSFLTLASDGSDRPTSEAMRQSMVRLANDNRHPLLSHPAVWGPFSVVGDR